MLRLFGDSGSGAENITSNQSRTESADQDNPVGEIFHSVIKILTKTNGNSASNEFNLILIVSHKYNHRARRDSIQRNNCQPHYMGREQKPKKAEKKWQRLHLCLIREVASYIAKPRQQQSDDDNACITCVLPFVLLFLRSKLS